MLAAQGLHWLDRRPPGPRWQSYGFAAAVTAGLFVLAFVSMRSVTPWTRTEREPAPIVVPLVPPPVIPRPREAPVVAPPPSTSRTAEQPRSRAAAPQIAAPIVTPTAPPIALPFPAVAPVDTTRPKASAPQIPTTPIIRPHNFGLPDTAMAIRGGAPYAPAGVTIASRTPNTAKLRDSIITEKLASIPMLARTTPMSAESQSVIDQSQAQARVLAQRSTSVGMQNVHTPMGMGVGGVGAVGGGKTGVSMDSRGVTVSMPFPLFSPGPSPEERRRNEKLLAEYLAYLRRQNDRILLMRDSIRADSAFRAAMSKPIVP
jgi:hypothetical protein